MQIANLTKTYNAKGILTNSDMKLTEVKKEDVQVHDLGEALKMFEGEEVTVTITLKQEVTPLDPSEE